MPDQRPDQRDMRIDPLGLDGTLTLPAAGMGIVLFAHGSGSSRHSPRNRHVAEALHESGLGTLLFDLLTEEEAADRQRVFDIDLLAQRLLLATDWLKRQPDTKDLPLGYFGASTGAAAALVAESESTWPIAAVVSRGGRPDLAGRALARVRAPVLLIVGGDDHPVLGLNEQALAQLPGEKEIAVINGATHLFEEPGALDLVVELARRWLAQRVTDRPPGRIEPRQPSP